MNLEQPSKYWVESGSGCAWESSSPQTMARKFYSILLRTAKRLEIFLCKRGLHTCLSYGVDKNYKLKNDINSCPGWSCYHCKVPVYIGKPHKFLGLTYFKDFRNDRDNL